MGSSVQTIPLLNLATIFIPVILVVTILFKWDLKGKNAVYAMSRMLVQLLLIGYLLNYIFDSKSVWIVLLVLTVMSLASSWIALGNLEGKRLTLFKYALVSILAGSLSTLAIVTLGVLDLDPWFMPRYIIPLAGMIFANAMNSISLAGERLESELKRGVIWEEARKIAMHASLIPITNSLFAVGLVSLPGMMTGQILSGISPLIAARYQIMVMCMVFGAAGLSSAAFLILSQSYWKTSIESTKPETL